MAERLESRVTSTAGDSPYIKGLSLNEKNHADNGTRTRSPSVINRVL